MQELSGQAKSSVAVVLLRQKFSCDWRGVTSPFEPPGQKPPAAAWRNACAKAHVDELSTQEAVTWGVSTEQAASRA